MFKLFASPSSKGIVFVFFFIRFEKSNFLFGSKPFHASYVVFLWGSVLGDFEFHLGLNFFFFCFRFYVLFIFIR
jgi:hypothetical protein